MDVYGRRAADVVKVNVGYVFLLLVINAQTKMVYFRPLRGKGGSEVAQTKMVYFRPLRGKGGSEVAQTKMVYFRPLRGKGGSEVAQTKMVYFVFQTTAW